MSRTHNRELLVQAAQLLEPVLEELVFVGGCTTALLITDAAAPDVRPTYDVDAIIEAASYSEYTTFSDRIRQLGFHEDPNEGAICRWRNGEVKLDLMPTDEAILGFSNRWYDEVMGSAERFEIESGLSIRNIIPPYFLATKLEAFRGRGNNVSVLVTTSKTLLPSWMDAQV